MGVMTASRPGSEGLRMEAALGHPARGGGGVEEEEDVDLTGLGQKSQDCSRDTSESG